MRQRYVNLIVNPETRRVARLRSSVLRSLREDLHARGFLEAETPILQPFTAGRTRSRSSPM